MPKKFKKQMRLFIGYGLIIIWTFIGQHAFAATDDTPFITQQKENEATVTAPFTHEILELRATAQKNSQRSDIQNYIRALQANSKAVLNPLLTEPSASSQGQILIFVSASMPQQSLQQWFKQATRIHAAVIVRGFIHHSLLETKSWVQGFMTQTNKKGGIQINPILFERYGIQQVPAVVATRQAIQCPSGMSCPTPPFDVVTGNVSLFEALRTLANQGDAANGIAQQALNQMRVASD